MYLLNCVGQGIMPKMEEPPRDIVILTKNGLVRVGENGWYELTKLGKSIRRRMLWAANGVY